MLINASNDQAIACSAHVPVILLADDDGDDRDLFAQALNISDQPFVLVTVSDGEQLMKYMSSSPLPDIVFLDLNMPRKNGSQCLSAIRNNILFKGIPVVILSTSINEAKTNQLLEEGASYCFSKPSEFSALVKILNKSLELIMHVHEVPAAT